jgi:hypothetical protein
MSKKRKPKKATIKRTAKKNKSKRQPNQDAEPLETVTYVPMIPT